MSEIWSWKKYRVRRSTESPKFALRHANHLRKMRNPQIKAQDLQLQHFKQFSGSHMPRSTVPQMFLHLIRGVLNLPTSSIISFGQQRNTESNVETESNKPLYSYSCCYPGYCVQKYKKNLGDNYQQQQSAAKNNCMCCKHSPAHKQEEKSNIPELF